ncbi:ASMT isoform 2 [Pan troglodytes]|uniref:Acetylserotonin O-methyltransferase n=2 Tax=Pan troglodytes TaxID=9598 RepID=A0A2I3RD31_PANTR|nr:acetylserotonin O-methyltransferase isoform X2 [Pan troglodytes]XP_054532336.1 acetylserotonin O-methyltransferase isoform X2 [Pan troglodytes]PNI11674.1 ASMT isoform 2 [Pan troglodytes]
MGSSEDHAYRLLNDYANGFMVSQVLFAACELGVFDLLAEAPGPLDVAAVAAGVGASAHGTELLLDICVSLKLLKVETRGGKASYRNTELSSDYLTTVSPTSQCSMLKYMGRTSYRCWGHLADAVREGRNQYLETFGVPAEELFTAIYRSDGERLQFMQALQEVWSVNGRSVLTAFDLSVFPLMCDLGGDFFKDPLPEADLYILARVLHDWADGKCSHLLERIYHTCKPGGGILVIESLLDEDRRGPLLTQLYSLNMLVQTEGQERTPTQYHMLLSSAGFRDFQFKKTGAIYDAILARK